jgi:hypothetical protein
VGLYSVLQPQMEGDHCPNPSSVQVQCLEEVWVDVAGLVDLAVGFDVFCDDW